VGEAALAPIQGWDFSWLDGRATEERPPWGYSRLVADRCARARAMVDLQSGGGELVAGISRLAPLTVVTEGWMPNVFQAATRLRPRGVHVLAAANDAPVLPLASGRFDLVTSRHPVVTWWDEVARVLEPGGTYMSQQVGPRSVAELSEFFLGPLPSGSARDPGVAVDAARNAGLDVVDLREATLRTVFDDVGAVIYFLRLVIWIVPGFSVDRYRERLRELHHQIESDGPFVAHATRFLIEARKP
jgi:SAM-dependent methyltransferase